MCVYPNLSSPWIQVHVGSCEFNPTTCFLFLADLVVSTPISPRSKCFCSELQSYVNLLHCLNSWWVQLAASLSSNHVTPAEKLLTKALSPCRWKPLQTNSADHGGDCNDTRWQRSFLSLEKCVSHVKTMTSVLLLCVCLHVWIRQVFLPTARWLQNNPRLTYREPICDTPRVWDMIHKTLDLTLCMQHLYASMCSLPAPAWQTGIRVCQLLISRVCQLAASRCLGHLIESMERKSMALCWLETLLTGINQAFYASKQQHWSRALSWLLKQAFMLFFFQ